jgi:hypothetical protein
MADEESDQLGLEPILKEGLGQVVDAGQRLC